MSMGSGVEPERVVSLNEVGPFEFEITGRRTFVKTTKSMGLRKEEKYGRGTEEGSHVKED